MALPHVGQFFLVLACVIAAAGVFGLIAKRLGQPTVLGEILAGIVLGPLLSGGVLAQLLTADVRSALTVVGNVGLALFMCTIGVELASAVERRHLRGTAAVAVGAAVLPLLLGCLLAFYLMSRHRELGGPGFVIFMGVAMSVTALPVLARILADRSLTRSDAGVTAMGAAAVNDLVAWALLAVAASMVGTAQWRLLLAPLYLMALFLAVVPLLPRVAARLGNGRAGAAVWWGIVVVGLWASCAAADWLGLHMVFGAFVWGVVVYRGRPQGAPFSAVGSPGQRVGRLCLPVYFFMAGIGVDLRGLGLDSLGEFALILLTAVAGKGVGTYAAARLGGASAGQARLLATLMNVRGLTELVMLAAGHQLGLLDGRLYTLMVLMALVTTFMTGPVLAVLVPRSDPGEESPGGVTVPQRHSSGVP
ncbi:cation:proton antiporter [Streptomyces sp. NPDC057555]|uniref:Sodium/hydrogen antiporter n=1 Tax=Streptomyces sp. JCM 9888 TaxID=1570103 RepID=A0A0B5H318_9ACTN|nr:sodium/hydrogen antiporter [Streptomyces sp. JCM 9888]